MEPLPLVAAVALAVLHLVAGTLRFLGGSRRSVWLSIAGGVSVTYVFVRILPELAEAQEAVGRAVGEGLEFVEHHVYLIALLGLAAFYGLERLATTSRRQSRAEGGEDATSSGVFWLHMASFSVYNALIGYVLVHREAPGVLSLALFALAMGLHFLVTDYGLREHHKEVYARLGRFILAGAVLLGWGIGAATEIGEAALGVLLAFLSGGVILNVLKEELPEERASRFWAFALGAGGYAALLLAL